MALDTVIAKTRCEEESCIGIYLKRLTCCVSAPAQTPRASQCCAWSNSQLFNKRTKHGKSRTKRPNTPQREDTLWVAQRGTRRMLHGHRRCPRYRRGVESVFQHKFKEIQQLDNFVLHTSMFALAILSLHDVFQAHKNLWPHVPSQWFVESPLRRCAVTGRVSRGLSVPFELRGTHPRDTDGLRTAHSAGRPHRTPTHVRCELVTVLPTLMHSMPSTR